MKKKTTNTPSTFHEEGRVARRRARVRADLLAAARQVFIQRGYQEATISEIIQIADVAMGTFYLHFRDKEELLLALAEEGLQLLREQIHTALTAHPDQPLIPLIIRTLLHAAYQERELFLLLCAGESHLLAQTRTHQAQQGLAAHFIPPLRAAKERGELKESDPVLLAHLLGGMLVRAITWWFDQDEPGPDAMADQVLGMLAHGLPSSLLTNNDAPTS
ncbi:TetR/AcrR family transcriptional regulator [Ktedonospora formicarum]|uniref:TetR family transcriptional regulator n=1 Tax=Ktedonospora formicarum TaxID=2778364 RepID=A0A8J3MWB4_9CHLR|nr:TetR/AcrR family transcriptional regulator [Ktedonospora formicarum]GHO48806.1 TetR family transcriptional regulator [Ktedonospora formicarum]